MKLYDCFCFWQELDMLDLRLRELSPYVDKFVLVESTRTFQLQPKRLYYAENKARFAEFNDRIVHVVVDELAPVETGFDQVWSQERFQHNCILRGLKDAADDDLALIADVDEIPSRDALKYLRDAGRGDGNEPWEPLMKAAVYLQTRLHYYYLDCISIQPNHWHRLVAATVKRVREETPNGLRVEYRQRLPRVDLCNAGWHLSYFGGPEAVVGKRAALAESEYLQPQFLNLDLVRIRMEEGADPLDRGYPCKFIPFDDNFPETVKANPAYYESLGWFRFPVTGKSRGENEANKG